MTTSPVKSLIDEQAHECLTAAEQDERDSEIAHIELCIKNLKAEHQSNPRVIAEVLHNIGYSRAAPIAQSALIKALKYYANGDHLLLADPDAWDTCSGEPMNFLHDEAGTASVEDGTIAKVALDSYRAALSTQEPQP